MKKVILEPVIRQAFALGVHYYEYNERGDWYTADILYEEFEDLVKEVCNDDHHYIRALEVLQIIATPCRTDGTWNKDREECRQLALDVLSK